MPLLWSATILLNIVFIIYMMITLRRLFRYTRKYQLEESKYTLLFGFLTLQQIGVLYAIFIFLFAIFSLWVVIKL